MRGSDLAQRIVVAAILLAVVVPPIVAGGVAFTALVVGMVGIGWWEYATMGRAGTLRPFVLVGLVGALALCALASRPGPARDIALAAVFLALALAALERRDGSGVLADMGYTLVGVVWLGWSAGYALLLRGLTGRPDGLAWLLTAVAITIAADTGAYAIGRAVGRRPLVPRVSPKKTVEGLIGGLLAAAAVGAGALAVLGLPWWLGVPLGLVGGVAAVVGDLLESLLKRQLGVKDASRLLPGHGGLLDRLDSLLFTIPALTACVMLIRGI